MALRMTFLNVSLASKASMAVIESPLRTPVEKVITLCSLFTAPPRLEMVGSLTKELAKVTFGGRTDSFVYDTRVPVRRGETRTRRKGGERVKRRLIAKI